MSGNEARHLCGNKKSRLLCMHLVTVCKNVCVTQVVDAYTDSRLYIVRVGWSLVQSGREEKLTLAILPLFQGAG